MTTLRLLLPFAAFLGALSPCTHAASLQVAGESSRTPPSTPLDWKAASFPERSAVRLDYRELPVRRVFELQQRNLEPSLKATQIGVGRALKSDGMAATTPALRWLPLRQGGAVARLQVTSPDALALRVGLRASMLHPHVELRFAGSEAPRKVLAMMTGTQMHQLAGANGLYWTPATDGATQIIEIYRPAHVAATQVRLDTPNLSHLVVNSRNDFTLAKSLGDSGACNVNAVCRAEELGAPYNLIRNAVARMLFVDLDEDGETGTFTCTGTLVNDTVASTQVPYFLSAHHCIDSQTVASTLNTIWRYESNACTGTTSQPVVQLTRGATYLFSDSSTDALLLRLNEAAPAGAEFAGWDASQMPVGTPVIGIHHPSGDIKKVSLGTSKAQIRYSSRNGVGWHSGTTEGGSSGSGIFTTYADGSYRLRGTLWGGSASCANAYSMDHPDNFDFYSRLDLIFPRMAPWLASEPVLERGSPSLVPGRSGPVMTHGPTTPATMAPASTPTPRAIRRVHVAPAGILER